MGEVVPFPNAQQVQEIPPVTVVKPTKKIKSRKEVVAPNAFAHIMFAVALGVLLGRTPIDMALIVFGSLLPDIDHRNSTLGKWNPLTRFMKHRGHCHSLAGSFLLSLPFALLGGVSSFLLVYIGCLSHIVADKVVSWLPRRQSFRIRIW